MLIKKKDLNEQPINYLSDLLEREISNEQRQYIDRELKCLRSGIKGEQSSSYYLDFDLKKTDNWAIIHDLRLEHDGNVAQIDHLLIGRMLDIYVIESKNFNSGVAISNEGEFSYFYKNRPIPIPSPILQNERHITVLKSFLDDNDLLPNRMGITLKPKFRNIVLISPTSRLTKPSKGLYDCSNVMKSDQFKTRFNNDMDTDNSSTIEVFSSIAKIISSQSLRTFAEKICSFDKPKLINYQAKFKLNEKPSSNNIAEPKVSYKNTTPSLSANPKCPKCNKNMIQKTGTRGSFKGVKFWGCENYPECKGIINTPSDEIDHKQDHITNQDQACPKCASPMIKRIAKKGKNEGQHFWGCSNFPKCRTTLAIEAVK